MTAPTAMQQTQSEKKVKKQAGKDLQKTRLCVYFLEGKCGYGTDCTFAHTPGEIRGAPDLRKTQLCEKFMSGKCTDEDCSFAHGEEELRDSPNFKKKLCKWNAKGQCRNGDTCGFAHNPCELRGTPPGFGQVPAPKISKELGPPPGLEAVDTKVAMKENESADRQLFHLQAARGAAPLQEQVVLMSSAVAALQSKLAALEGMVMQSQVSQMQQSIQQLNEQCWALEAGLGNSPVEPPPEPLKTKSRLSAKATPFVPFGNAVCGSDDSTSVGSD